MRKVYINDGTAYVEVEKTAAGEYIVVGDSLTVKGGGSIVDNIDLAFESWDGEVVDLPVTLHDRTTYDALRLTEKDALPELWCSGHPGSVRSIAQGGVADAFASMSRTAVTTGPTRAGKGVGPILPAVAEMLKMNSRSQTGKLAPFHAKF